MRSNASKPVKVKQEIELITLESAGLKKYTYETPEELKKIVLKNCKFVTRELNSFSKIQIEATKKLEQYVEKQKNHANESFIFVDEAKRLKGMTIPARGGALDIAKNDEELEADLADLGHDGWEAVDDIKENPHFSLREKDYAEMDARSTVDKISLYRLKKIKESKNIIQEYNKLIDCHIDDIINKTESYLNEIGDSKDIDCLFTNTIFLLKKHNYSDEEIRNYLKGHYFIQSDDPAVIRALLQLRINYCKKARQTLLRIIKANHDALGLNFFERKWMSYRLNSGNNVNIIDKIDIEKFKVRDGFYDFRPLSPEWKEGNKKPNVLPGCVFYSREGRDNILKKSDFRSYFTLALRYDAVVVGHGGEEYRYKNGVEELRRTTTNQMNDVWKMKDEIENIVDDFGNRSGIYSIPEDPNEVDDIINNIRNSDEFNEFEKRKMINKFEEYRSLLKDYNSNLTNFNTMSFDRKNKEYYWSIEPIETEKHPETDDVNTVIRNLIAEGHKRIMLLSCNVAHHKIADDIMRKPGIVINYQDNIMYS